MAPGRVHVAESERMAGRLGLSVPREAHVVVQRLIDQPWRVPKLLWRRLIEECPDIAGRLQPRVEAGLRIPGVASHDWRGRIGRQTLYRVVECLYGREARLLVDLHMALDDLWEGRDPEASGYDPRVLRYLRERRLLPR